VDLIVGFALPGSEEPGVFFFGSPLSKSRAGEHIAVAVADCLSLPIAGRAVPLLKNTRAPAIVVAVEPLDAAVGGAAAQGLIDLFAGRSDDTGHRNRDHLNSSTRFSPGPLTRRGGKSGV
jgi:hypothetical protein